MGATFSNLIGRTSNQTNTRINEVQSQKRGIGLNDELETIMTTPKR